MEGLQESLHRRKSTLNSDKSSDIRMAQRPGDLPGWEWHDSGFKRETRARGNSTRRSCSPQSARHSSTSRRERINDILSGGGSNEGSSDELCLRDVSSSTKKGAASPKRKQSTVPNGEYTYSGIIHDRKGTLKNLKFKKNKDSEEISTPETNASPSVESISTPESRDCEVVDGEVYRYGRESHMKQSIGELVPARVKKPSSSTRSVYSIPPAKTPQKIPDSLRREFKPPSKVVTSTAGSSRTAPSRASSNHSLPTRTRPSGSGDSTNATSKGGRALASSSRSTILSTLDSDSEGDMRKDPPPKSKSGRRKAGSDSDESVRSKSQAVKPKLREFPMELSPTPRDELTTPKPATKVNKGKQPANNFPDLSPLSSQPSKSLSRTSSLTTSSFPSLPPLSSPISTHEKPSRKKASKRSGPKARGRIIESSSEQPSSSEDDGSHQARPFPMETQMLESISDSPLKRNSEDDDLGIYRHKRRKRQGHEILNELLDPDEDEDLNFMNPDMDYSTLCPWCDELLPPVPSPHLQSLIDTARKRSYRDSRPTNPLGLRAPLTVFVAVCQRHTFERVHVPQAQQNGWPMSIQWEELGNRVVRLKGALKRIVDDVDEEWLPGHTRSEDENEVDVDEDEVQQTRPRRGSTFWKDVIRNVQSHGSRQTMGVRNQFSNFAKTQPGYYGELGYVIIHQTIYDLFPPASFDSESTLPLSPTEFIQLILVPEAAVSLIMDDLQQSRAQAIRTLRASAEYGVAMFPDEAGGSNVGENIVRERAKARRKALEAEGETVQDEDDVIEVEAPKKKRGRPRKIDRAEESDAAMLTDASRSGVSRPKPRPKKRGAGDAPSSQPIPNYTPTVLDLCDSTDSMTVSTSQEGARPRPKPRRRARAPNTDGHQSHTDVSDSAEPKTYVPKPEPIVVDVDVEETPRPAKLGKQPSGMVLSMLSVRDAPAQEIRQPTIMELARQRKSRREENGKSADGWSHNFHELMSESDDHMYSDASRASKTSRRGRSKGL